MATLLGADRRVAVLGIARMTEAAGETALVVVLPLYIASGVLSGGRLGLTEALLTGIVLSATGLASSLFQPVPGRLSDALGRRTAFILGGLGARAITFVGYLFVPTYLLLLLLRGLQGLASSFVVPTTLALISEYSDVGTRGAGMGVYTALRLVGSVAGPILAGLIVALGPYAVPTGDGPATLSGFQVALLAAAVAAAASFLLVFVFVSDPVETVPRDRSALSLPVLGRPGRLLDPVFVVSAGAFLFGINISMIAAIEPLINERLGQTAAWFGVQYAAFLFAMVVFATPFGVLSDRHGRLPWLVLAWFVLVPSTLAQGFVVTPAGMLLSRLGQGFAAAMAFAPAVAMVGDRARHLEAGDGTQLSMFTMLLGVGLAAGPVFSGYLVRFGYPTPFVAAAALGVVGFVLVVTQVDETHEDFRGTDRGIRRLLRAIASASGRRGSSSRDD